ncbi:fimbrial subunit [Salmonella enterica subsp. enterica serovar Typhimurium]|nr:fimbrial subunit [Salmonella enterica subsp. enterica serovar Typhimurium]
MNRSHCALFAMGLMLCPQINASADDLAYNLEFTGTIVAQTCDIDISSLSQSIDLGQFAVGDFPSTGTTTKFKPFNINLKKLFPRNYRGEDLVYRRTRSGQSRATGDNRHRDGKRKHVSKRGWGGNSE